jgi:asparagine synthase (glutamine-hydrolysing)
MSGFIGIFNADEAPVDCGLLERLTGSLTFRGPDARAVWCQGSVGFGHTLFRTTWEARYERQPFTLDQQVWIVADARVDAREDLVRELGCGHDLALNQTPDVELVLRAYLKWGEACLDHMIGDFSFAIWDGRSRRLFCARDHFGVKLFYYAWIGASFIFSNTIAALRLHPQITNRLNERALGDFLLADCNLTLDTTFFADIQKLPAAHQLIVADTGLKRRKYWQLVAPERVSYRGEEECVEGFRERFEQAVADRLRTEKVSISFSGGLDSTNMALAARNAHHRRGQQTDLKAFTAVYDMLIPDDERHYSGMAAQSLNIPIDYLCLDSDQPFAGWSELLCYQPEPLHDPQWIASLNFYNICSAHGAVLLDGSGGDEIFPKTWLSTQLRYQGLPQALTDFCRSIFRHQVFPRLGTGILVRFRKFVRPGISPAAAAFPDWLRPEFARKLSLSDRWARWSNKESQTIDPLDALATPPERRFIAPLWDRHLYCADIGQHGVRIEVRLPYLDLRVVAFGLSLPRMPWSCHKYLLRRLGATLPKEITSRPKTPLRADPIARSLQRNKELVLKLAQLPLVPLLEEMICAGRWRRTLRETSFETQPPLWELLRVVTLNYWLQRNATAKREL